MAGLKAATLPAATATGDLMFAQAKRDQDAYDDDMTCKVRSRWCIKCTKSSSY